MANDTISILVLAAATSPVVDCVERAFPRESNTSIRIVSTLRVFRETISSTTPDIVLMDSGAPSDIRRVALDIPPESRTYPIVAVATPDVKGGVDESLPGDGVFDSIAISPETAAIIPQTVRLLLRAWKLSVQIQSGAEESNKLAKTAQVQQNRLSALLRASNVILTTTSFDDAARRIFDICRDATGAQSGYVALLSEDGAENEVLFLESGGLPCTVDPELPMPIRGLRARAYETGKPAYDNDFMNSEWLRFMPKGHVILNNVMFAPLNRNGKTIGLIGLANKPEGFTDEDALIAGSLADRIAAVLIMTREQEILRESEELYRQLFEAESDAIFLIDNETGDIIEANNAASTLYGYSREHLLRMRNVDLSSEPEETARVTHGTPVIKDNIVTIPLRYHLKKDGTVFPVEITGRFFVRKARPVHIAAIRDITERLRTEEALRESEGRVREKLNAVLSPEGSIENLELADIIDTKAFQSMMDDLYNITCFSAAIIDLEGNVLVSVGLQDICTKFHHRNPESFEHCRESDTLLTTGVEPGVFKVYRCKNNMLDVVTPIHVAGKHIGNLFLGQFFYDDEEVDIEVFREQARRYGFDEAAYLEALGRVPRWSREKVQTAMSFYLKLSSAISQLSHSNLKLARALTERDQLFDSLRRKEAALNDAQHLAKIGNWEYSVADDSLFWSSEMFRIFGKDPSKKQPTRRDFLGCIYDEDRKRVNAAIKAGLKDGSPHNFEFRILTGEGELRWVWVKGQAERGGDGKIVRFFGTMQDIDERKRTEEALRKREEQYRTLFENLKQGVFYQKRSGELFDVNDAALEIFGLTEDQFLGRTSSDPRWEVIDSLSNPLPPENHPSMVALATGEPVKDFLLGVRNIDRNHFRWVVVNAVPQFAPGDDNPYQVFVSMHDITELKHTEEELRREKERAQKYLDIAGIIMLAISPDQTITLVNRKACEILGYNEDELIGKNWFDMFIPAEQRDTVKAVFNELTAGTTELWEYNENTVLAKTGKKLIAWHNTLLRDDDGSIIGTLSSGEDITDRRRAENDLLESENKFRSIAEQIGDVIFITDAQGAITYISPASEKMFGCMPEEMTGRHFAEFLDPSSVQTATEAFMSAIENKHDTRNLEMLMKRSDGALFHGEVSGTRYVLGDVTGTLGVIRDISGKKQAEEEKKKLEQQVQHAQKLESLGVLAGGIAHDFNNILMVILGHADLAMEDTSTISPARKSLREIVTASRRAAELCNQMLAYSGRASFVIERIQLGAVIEEMAHLLKSSINKKAAFNMNITRDLPAIEADPSQIRQIAMNLIINASDAIGDRSGIITLTVAATRFEEDYLKETEIDSNLPAGLYVYLEVADTGCGMDEETRARLFEPFFTTKFTGRGLGLAAVLGIVRAHRGAIKVYSEKGKGTTFKVLIPAAEDNGSENRSAYNGRSPADWKGSGTILIADDDESVRALCARMLERLGFTVITAVDGSVALDVYRQRRDEIDLVILDLTMPHMDGVEAFSALRRENSKLKIVLASGYSEEDVASRVAGKGLSGVIQKPYTISKLRELLSEIM